MAKRPKMVGWFDPPLLASTAVRVAISHVFGEFVDRRESMAAARELDHRAIDPVHRYAAEPGQPFWFDFVADTGEGFNPTFAIARLLAEPELEVAGAEGKLPMGRLLVMGGDQVYPTASRIEYQERLVAPFDEARRGVVWPPGVKPDVYAVPGNHDWYDGLSSFLGVFARRRKRDEWAAERGGREVGGRATQQTRSYFALQLPHGWWLWGADIQLSGYIDQPQIDFFTHVANSWMDEGSKLIICTGQPTWTHVDPANPKPVFENFSYFERLAGISSRKGHRLCAVLTGDSHHYARFVETRGDRSECHYVTAGGGGAFLHPTHHLRTKTFDWDYPPPGIPPIGGQAKYTRTFDLRKVFPDEGTSRRLAWRNFLFAFINWSYALTLGAGCLFFAWLLHAQASMIDSTLMGVLARPSIADAAWAYVRLVFISPWPPILVLLGFGGYYYLSAFRPKRKRLVAGGVHTAVHAGVVVLVSCLLAQAFAAVPAASLPGWLAPYWKPTDAVLPNAVLILAIGVVGGFLSATIAGFYFMLSLNWFGVHWNEAFSALAIQDHKCFLRLCIRPDGTAEIYPIGLDKVPREPRSGPLQRPKLEPHLIEKDVKIGRA
jgi:hypothetical protein